MINESFWPQLDKDTTKHAVKMLLQCLRAKGMIVQVWWGGERRGHLRYQEYDGRIKWIGRLVQNGNGNSFWFMLECSKTYPLTTIKSHNTILNWPIDSLYPPDTALILISCDLLPSLPHQTPSIYYLNHHPCCSYIFGNLCCSLVSYFHSYICINYVMVGPCKIVMQFHS